MDPPWFHYGSVRDFYVNADPDPGSQTNADPDPNAGRPGFAVTLKVEIFYAYFKWLIGFRTYLGFDGFVAKFKAFRDHVFVIFCLYTLVPKFKAFRKLGSGFC